MDTGDPCQVAPRNVIIIDILYQLVFRVPGQIGKKLSNMPSMGRLRPWSRVCAATIVAHKHCFNASLYIIAMPSQAATPKMRIRFRMHNAVHCIIMAYS